MCNKKFIIKNGLLHKDGKPIFAIGTSYYPSYHARKVSVPEDGDRIGEMKKDIQLMAESGIHLFRCASLGKVWYDENKNVCTDTPFIDAMIEHAQKCEIGVMVRLQGYSMNLSNWDDAMMVDSEGEPMDSSIWWDFIQNSFYHKGILEDNNNGTRALAEHFAPMSSVIGFQTYNEPHYPSKGIYDYHPETVKAFKKWLCNYMTEEEAMATEPPHARPDSKSEDRKIWILWRLFSMQSLSNFLNDCSDVAKNATGMETMTCLTTDPTTTANAGRGVSFFDNAERMDALGITQYYKISKPEAYLANLNLDLAESAAATFGKPMWLVEYDARTGIPPEVFRRLNYMALGSGCKGIMHYQWRGDYIFPDSPEGNGFGFLNYDGTKTANFDNAINVISLINQLSDYFVNSQKLRSGVGILHSDYAYMNADANDNKGINSFFWELKNSWLKRTVEIYTDLRKSNISPDFTRAKDLETNPLGIKVLFVPSNELLSDEEKQMVESFAEEGGKVVYFNRLNGNTIAYTPYGYKSREYKSDYDMEDIIKYMSVKPSVVMYSPKNYLHQTLKGDGYYIVVITNIANIERESARITLEADFTVNEAIVYTFENKKGTKALVDNGKISLENISDGAILILKEK